MWMGYVCVSLCGVCVCVMYVYVVCLCESVCGVCDVGLCAYYMCMCVCEYVVWACEFVCLCE